jgi:coenzyme Q-binding protein COQ10
MSSHTESRILPYPADLMYGIVSDVEKYPQFLPWVTGLKITRRISDTEFEAEMRVGFAGINERFTSRVTLDPEARTISVVKAAGGPFRVLENHWHFTPRGDICNVDFAIAFEFRSSLLNVVAGAAFQRAMLKMADAFEARARWLSGRVSV